ncbi:MAG: AIR synthase-related protein [Bacteriovorax sp.]|nr:AIR synthase-related protein [Bacteriovorax sp.]
MKKEIAYIQALIKNYPRSGKQLNSPFHSDAEILKVKDGYLGVSVDAVSEEIELQLINNPVTLGWLTVTASVSDLSAVGMKTERISLLLKDKNEDQKWQQEFFQGVAQASAEYQIVEVEKIITKGVQTLTACTAYGLSSEAPNLSRVGLVPGDSLFLTGPIGWGNAVALANIALRKQSSELADKFDLSYRPKARWREALFINQYSKVCIDTSDGLLATLKWLEIFNQTKLVIDYKKSLFHPVALEVASLTKVNPWLFMASQNGEFELLFSVSTQKKAEFLTAAMEHEFHFQEIGKVESGAGICLNGKDLNLEQLLDMLHDGVEPEIYIRKMLEYAVNNEIRFEE